MSSQYQHGNLAEGEITSSVFLHNYEEDRTFLGMDKNWKLLWCQHQRKGV